MLRTSGVDPSNGPSFGGFPGAPQGQQGGGFPFSAGTPLGRSLILTRRARGRLRRVCQLPACNRTVLLPGRRVASLST
jgi:hypothetical protein